MTTLVLHKIGFDGRHGATAKERHTTRRFEVDVEIDAELEVAERSDRLADTIDYRAVADTVVALGTGEPHRLLEALARRMVGALEDRLPNARAIRIEIRKLIPPGCAGQPAWTAVRVSSAHR